MNSMEQASRPEPLKAAQSDNNAHILREGEMENQEKRRLLDRQQNPDPEQHEEQRQERSNQSDHAEERDSQEKHKQIEELEEQAKRKELEVDDDNVDAENDTPAHPSTPFKKKKTRSTRPRKRRRVQSGRRERTTWVDPSIPLERPTEADLEGFAALPRRHFLHLQRADLAEETSEADGQVECRHDDATDLEQEPLMASSPRIPEHDDDAKEFVEVGVPELRPIHRRKRKQKGQKEPSNKRRRLRSVREEEEEELPTIEPLIEPEPSPEPIPEPANFLSLSPEIREFIYRQLLLSPKSIQVHGNWTLVYPKRKRPALYTSILRVNRRIHSEASRILYGENTFLYLLRDRPNTVANIHSLATNDDRIIAGQEHESDSEYEDEPVHRNARRRALRKRKDAECHINLDKYLPLFRRIAVEAEHNRYMEDTQESMANAIKMFAYRPPDDHQTWDFNVRTLTIRISPRWDLPETPDGEGSFTFVNFFEPGSRVLNAINSVECQYLRVELLAQKRKPCRLSLDMRHRRLSNQLAREGPKEDWWVRDKVMLLCRGESVNRSSQAVNDLARHIEQHCRERNLQKETTNGPEWDAEADLEEGPDVDEDD